MIFKNREDIHKLRDRIQPTNRTIDIKDINDTHYCVYSITKMKYIKDNYRIFQYIKGMNEEKISKFVHYSRIFSSIIEIEDINDSDNVYDKVVKIIANARFIISQDTEHFIYPNNKKDPKKIWKI